jgi:hypothetical protein
MTDKCSITINGGVEFHRSMERLIAAAHVAEEKLSAFASKAYDEMAKEYYRDSLECDRIWNMHNYAMRHGCKRSKLLRGPKLRKPAKIITGPCRLYWGGEYIGDTPKVRTTRMCDMRGIRVDRVPFVRLRED